MSLMKEVIEPIKNVYIFFGLHILLGFFMAIISVNNVFEKMLQETYGKTGCRRITPGQFLAVDPNGRAIMIAALEKQKMVYVMNRDASERLTISSPLEAHKAKNILSDVVGIDVNFENPVFACLELDYADVDTDPTGEAYEESERYLTFYQLDLGMYSRARCCDGGVNVDLTKWLFFVGI